MTFEVAQSAIRAARAQYDALYPNDSFVTEFTLSYAVPEVGSVAYVNGAPLMVVNPDFITAQTTQRIVEIMRHESMHAQARFESKKIRTSVPRAPQGGFIRK